MSPNLLYFRPVQLFWGDVTYDRRTRSTTDHIILPKQPNLLTEPGALGLSACLIDLCFKRADSSSCVRATAPASDNGRDLMFGYASFARNGADIMSTQRNASSVVCYLPPGRRGFTLIEILVVIILIAIIGSVVAPNVFRHVASAKITTAEAQLRALEAALDAYRLDVGRYPSTDDGLSALEQRPADPTGSANWRGPYLRQAVPTDPWGARYQYRSPSTDGGIGYDLFSFGADGNQGGEGEDSDISIRPIRP